MATDTIIFIDQPGRSVDPIEIRHQMRRERGDMELLEVLERIYCKTWEERP